MEISKQQIERIEEFVQGKLDSLDWEHVRQMRPIARKLASLEKADKGIVEAAVLLHDVGKCQGNKDHITRSEAMARKHLEHQGFEQSFVEEVVYCIAVHDYHWIGKANLMKTIESKVLADADSIQKLSPWGVIRHSIKYQDDFNRDFASGAKRLWEKLMKCYNLILTKNGRKLAEPGYKFIKEFFKDLL